MPGYNECMPAFVSDTLQRRGIGAGFAMPLLAAVALWLGLPASVHADPLAQYPRTIKTLQQLYRDEVRAVNQYSAYAEKAYTEKYYNIGHLFEAIAVSESIHAHNAAQLLSEMDIDLGESPGPDIIVLDTQANILQASSMEVEEVDLKYPKILGYIAREKHKEARRYIVYAWKAERQHRHHMQKIKFAAKSWFSVLVKFIESEPTTYYVCQICGSTLTELPEKRCPICHYPVSNYMQVERSSSDRP